MAERYRLRRGQAQGRELQRRPIHSNLRKDQHMQIVGADQLRPTLHRQRSAHETREVCARKFGDVVGLGREKIAVEHEARWIEIFNPAPQRDLPDRVARDEARRDADADTLARPQGR